MAKINNQAVMQKLIDELKLYPGKDMIPSEIADKILATYQINEQAVTFKDEGEIKSLPVSSTGDLTITVPEGKKWEILGGFITWAASATVRTRYPGLTIRDNADNPIYKIIQNTRSITASQTIGVSFNLGHDALGVAGNVTLQLPSPIILSEDMDLFIQSLNDDGSAWGANDDTLSGNLWVKESDI